LVDVMPGRRIFIHFVDDEVVLALGAADTGNALAKVEDLIRLLIVISPEPPLFPLSARHELREISQLLDRLEPFIADGYLSITGAGASPLDYLHRRRRQFSRDEGRAGTIFLPSEDSAVRRYGSVWVAKTGDSTAAIAAQWSENVLADRAHLLTVTRQGAAAPADRSIDRVLDIPRAPEGRPLIPGVVFAELTSHDIVEESQIWLLKELAQFLGSEWARVYATDLDARILGDLGALLPNIRTFLPSGVPTVSALRAQRSFHRLGWMRLLTRFTNEGLSAFLTRYASLHVEVVDDLFDRAATSTPLWSAEEVESLRHYDRLVQRRAFSLATALSRDYRISPEAFSLARGFEAYSKVIGSFAAKAGGGLVTVDRSVHVGSVHGTAQIASGDHAVFNAITANPSELPALLAARLVATANGQGSVKEFVDLVSTLQAHTEGDIDAVRVTQAVEDALGNAELPRSGRRRLKAISGDLALKAGGGVIAGAILAGLKFLGL
jgi:hypothetical protein